MMRDNIAPCKYCTNRNKIKKAGSELMQVIEEIDADVKQTDAVIAANDFIELANKESGNKFDCQNKECGYYEG